MDYLHLMPRYDSTSPLVGQRPVPDPEAPPGDEPDHEHVPAASPSAEHMFEVAIWSRSGEPPFTDEPGMWTTVAWCPKRKYAERIAHSYVHDTVPHVSYAEVWYQGRRVIRMGRERCQHCGGPDPMHAGWCLTQV